MILRILFWITSPLIAFITIVIIKDLSTYIKYLIHYKSQGIKYEYVPFLGILGFLLNKKGNKDVGSTLRNISNKKYKNEKIVAFNNFESSQVGLILKDPKLIGKLFLKETEHIVRQRITKVVFQQGFFWERGKKALEKRATFNDFFQPSNLVDFVPMLRKVIDKSMEELKIQYDEREDKTDDFMRINLEFFFFELFSTIVNEIMFGNDFPVMGGKTVPQKVSEVIAFTYMKILKHPLNILTFGFLHSHDLLPSSKKAIKMAEEIKKVIGDTIKKKQKLKKEERGMNLLDLMVGFNETVPEDKKIDISTMVANLVLFQSAGMDTSKNTTEGLIDYLSRDTEKRKKLVEEILPNLYKTEEDKLKYETYENNEFLTGLVFESLRKFGPAHIAFPKKLVKDMQLGEYKLKKGSFILIPIYSIHKNQENWEKPDEFDETRFAGDKRGKRNTFMPFSLGRRACPGKYLAELTIKIIIASFFEKFELREIEGREAEYVTKFSYTVKDCTVDLRPRRS